MTYDKLLAKIDEELATDYADSCGNFPIGLNALRAVVERHHPEAMQLEFHDTEQRYRCAECKSVYGDWVFYPCPTIQEIVKVFQ